jgi:single-stranded DNA-specific DHH superfamily exonuclease
MDVARIAPFGMHNTKPVFCIPRVRITAMKQFGKDKNHIELMLAQDSNHSVRAFNFFSKPESFSYTPTVGADVRVLATFERDTYRGYQKYALRVVDIFAVEG